MIKRRYYEDYQVGHSWTTMGRTITEADIVLHAGQSGDFYPHHMDAEWSKTQEFGQRVAHGTLTFTVVAGLTAGDVNPEAFSYGYDRVRFVRPVFIGDTIHARVTLKEMRSSPKRPGYGIVVEFIEGLKQRDELVLVCDHLLMVRKRELV